MDFDNLAFLGPGEWGSAGGRAFVASQNLLAYGIIFWDGRRAWRSAGGLQHCDLLYS
jgi:hypothetical protein